MGAELTVEGMLWFLEMCRRDIHTIYFFIHAKFTCAYMREETNVRTTKRWTVSRTLGMVVRVNRHANYKRVNYSSVRVT